MLYHHKDTSIVLFRDKFFISSSDMKFEIGKVARFHDQYGAEIIAKYRKEKPTDTMFDNVPTFREFVEYIVNLPISKFDVHWKPVYIQCMPCNIKYDILARVDTITKDSEKILASLGVDGRLSVSHSTNSTTDKRVSTYYSTLTRDLITRLYQVYKFDFLMFDYTYSQYFDFITR